MIPYWQYDAIHRIKAAHGAVVRVVLPNTLSAYMLTHTFSALLSTFVWYQTKDSCNVFVSSLLSGNIAIMFASIPFAPLVTLPMVHISCFCTFDNIVKGANLLLYRVWQHCQRRSSGTLPGLATLPNPLSGKNSSQYIGYSERFCKPPTKIFLKIVASFVFLKSYDKMYIAGNAVPANLN